MPTPVSPQHLYLRAQIAGTKSKTLDRRFIRSLRLTNSLLSGAGEADLDCYVSPGDPWPWGLRAMDTITVDGYVGAAPGAPTERQWQRLYTGVLTDVPVAEAADTGFHVPLKAATVWHILEAATESSDVFQLRYQQANVPVGQFLLRMAGLASLPNLSVELGPDINTGLVSLAALDPQGYATNPQYLSYAAVMASVARMAGRELYADEDGIVNYRPSHYHDDYALTVPAERLISVSASLDSDDGLIDRVQVRYGMQELQNAAGNAPAKGQEIMQTNGQPFDRAHYRDRLLVIAAPWLRRQADADWLAQWALSWGVSNTRPAVVSLNFWPEVNVGTVVRLPWPKGQATDYYVSSVVHQIEVGGPAVTTLGLTYGRAPGFVWDIPQAPANFGQYSAQEVADATAPAGSGWRITYYTPGPAGNAGQPALAEYQDNPALGPDLRASSGARYFRDGWQSGPSAPLQDYSVRPCAIDPSYVVPELGVTLAMGDRLLLAESGLLLQCADIGGEIIGRHLDVFFWDKPNPVPARSETVRFVKVKNYRGTLSDIPGYGTPTPAGNAPVPGRLDGPLTGETGDSQLASFAAGVAQTLVNTGTYYDDAPAATRLATFCKQQGYALPNGDGLAWCILFVRFCLLHSGYPAPKVGDGKDAGRLVQLAGYQDVTGRIPAPGDVVYFDTVGSGAPPGSEVSQGNGGGHAAIITAVSLPTQAQQGSITVAQASCTRTIQQFPLLLDGSSYVVGSQPGFGPWLGICRPAHPG